MRKLLDCIARCLITVSFSDRGEDCAQVTCVYLFHELPAGVRRAVAAEMARVLRPGGLVVLVDSVQARAHAVPSCSDRAST